MNEETLRSTIREVMRSVVREEIQSVIREELKRFDTFLGGIAGDITRISQRLEIFDAKFTYYDEKINRLDETLGKVVDFLIRQSERYADRFSNIEDRLEFLEKSQTSK